MNPSLILCSILQGLILQNQTTPISLRCLHLSTERVILPFLAGSSYFPCPVGSWVKFRWWWAWRWKSFQIRRRRRGKWISYLYFYYKGSHHPPKSDFWRRKNHNMVTPPPSAIYKIPDFLTLWKTGSLQAQNRYILSFEKTWGPEILAWLVSGCWSRSQKTTVLKWKQLLWESTGIGPRSFLPGSSADHQLYSVISVSISNAISDCKWHCHWAANPLALDSDGIKKQWK